MADQAVDDMVEAGIEAASDMVSALPPGQQRWDKKEFMIAETSARAAIAAMPALQSIAWLPIDELARSGAQILARRAQGDLNPVVVVWAQCGWGDYRGPLYAEGVFDAYIPLDATGLPVGGAAVPPRLINGAMCLRLLALQHRMQSRVDAMVERDGSVEAAVTGPGIGIGYLLVRDVAACLGDVAKALSPQAEVQQFEREPMPWLDKQASLAAASIAQVAQALRQIYEADIEAARSDRPVDPNDQELLDGSALPEMRIISEAPVDRMPASDDMDDASLPWQTSPRPLGYVDIIDAEARYVALSVAPADAALILSIPDLRAERDALTAEISASRLLAADRENVLDQALAREAEAIRERDALRRTIAQLNGIVPHNDGQIWSWEQERLARSIIKAAALATPTPGDPTLTEDGR